MMANAPNWAMLMDLLALGASVILIGWLIFNRIRYGHLVSRPHTARADFNAEITLQALTQQSLLSYRTIQQTLQNEFESLQRLTAGDQHGWPDGDRQLCREDDRGVYASEAGSRHADSYQRALGMIQKGLDQPDIARRCGLTLGEIDLMTYMQQKQR